MHPPFSRPFSHSVLIHSQQGYGRLEEGLKAFRLRKVSLDMREKIILWNVTSISKYGNKQVNLHLKSRKGNGQVKVHLKSIKGNKQVNLHLKSRKGNRQVNLIM